MATSAASSLPAISGHPLASKLVILLSSLLVLQAVFQHLLPAIMSSKLLPSNSLLLAFAQIAVAQTVDLSWHAPAQTVVNNLTNVVSTTGVYGFIYNTSNTPDDQYGVYNWCNMPHVRKTEYVKPSSDYELKFVELIHRHHKRTVYASNSFPVESYQWNCDDEGLYYFARPFEGNKQSAEGYWAEYLSPINPFKPSGFLGSCQFPQITAAGLDDSWQHGSDLYGVYHDLLGFLPAKGSSEWRSKVNYRVTNNVITSEVAGMVVNGMWGITDSIPFSIQPSGVDSLEPQYGCNTGSNLFNAIKSSSNANWTAHFTAATQLYAQLDDISGVSPTDGGFHASFDHYYDNLSARQCHAKPLPCKLVNGVNSTTCVTQAQADEVFRFGNWEYSQIYRDAPQSLPASVASYGVWVAELASHIRDAVAGNSTVIYRHNVAHDGSVSRLLSILQVDVMVWPGMGSEVVFELWQKKPAAPATSTTLSTVVATPTVTVGAGCSRNNCLRQAIGKAESVLAFCPTYTTAASTAVPTWLNNCADAAAVSSACSCIGTATATATSAPATTTTAAPTPTSPSNNYVRVLFGGQVLKSSNPSLGLIDLIPVETLLAYFDGLVGANASLVQGKCNA